MIDGPAEPETSRPPSRHAYSRVCALLSKASLMLAVVLLIAIIVCVQYQVVGRYLFNDTPVWAEGLALQLVLYVTALGVAVGVRDAGHIGLDSLVALLPESLRLKIEILIHALVALFGAIMVSSGWLWTRLKWSDIKPMLGIPVGMDYLALVIAGMLIVLFSVEHIVALLRDEEVVPAWN
ncbi:MULTISPECIES: TRAP transporter small permease [unclassified Variovorax]|uniref:TRAP transporter small permease n=1 Tax=unclassified Variovorax TaxID=663243 RepID=UPI00089068CB|nr:TRAP-type C4-dicarboxylate transport system, small permease component [Variovorax sp. CF079]